MIPSIKIITTEITEPLLKNKTYKIKFNVNSLSAENSLSTAILGIGTLGYMILGSRESTQVSTNSNINRITGYINDLEAVKQAIYLILSTERYQYLIYSWDYGIELLDLIGKPMPYVIAEVPRRIKEALIQDNRIEDVIDFEFEKKGKQLHVKFTVVSNIGNIPTELEVDV